MLLTLNATTDALFYRIQYKVKGLKIKLYGFEWGLAAYYAFVTMDLLLGLRGLKT